MKKQFLISLFVLCSVTSFAQSNAMLTKEETVNYIDKVLKRSIGYKSLRDLAGCYCMSIRNSSFKIENDEIVYSIRMVDSDVEDGSDDSLTVTYKFNPVHITGIVTDRKYYIKEPLKIFDITFIGKGLVRSEESGKDYSGNEVGIYVLIAENSDIEKIKKAIFHLRDLYKAEEDPFGN